METEKSAVWGWYLMYGAAMLVDIVSMPSLGSGSESVDTTTLSQRQRTHKPGLKGSDALDFVANYEPADYKKILDLEGQELDLAVWHGDKKTEKSYTPDGHLGKWSFKGTVEVWKNEQNNNSAPLMTVRVTPTTEITFEEGASA